MTEILADMDMLKVLMYCILFFMAIVVGLYIGFHITGD